MSSTFFFNYVSLSEKVHRKSPGQKHHPNTVVCINRRVQTNVIKSLIRVGWSTTVSPVTTGGGGGGSQTDDEREKIRRVNPFFLRFIVVTVGVKDGSVHLKEVKENSYRSKNRDVRTRKEYKKRRRIRVSFRKRPF